MTSHEELFNPKDKTSRPPKPSEEEKEKLIAKVEEMNRKTREDIEQERRDGIDVDAKYACGRNRSDYNLESK